MADQDQGYKVLVAIFDSKDDAIAAEGQVEQMAKQGYIDLKDVALATKGMDLKVHVNDLADEHKRGWKTGAVAGGVLGVIFPPSILVSAAVGAAAGQTYNHFRDKGMSNKALTEAGEQLQPGQSALIAVAQDRFVDQVTQGLAGYDKLDKYLVNADTGTIVKV